MFCRFSVTTQRHVANLSCTVHIQSWLTTIMYFQHKQGIPTNHLYGSSDFMLKSTECLPAVDDPQPILFVLPPISRQEKIGRTLHSGQPFDNRNGKVGRISVVDFRRLVKISKPLRKGERTVPVSDVDVCLNQTLLSQGPTPGHIISRVGRCSNARRIGEPRRTLKIHKHSKAMPL